MIENILAIVNADVCERTGAKQAKCRAKMRVSCASNQTRHLERCKFLCEHSNTQIFFSVNCFTMRSKLLLQEPTPLTCKALPTFGCIYKS